jgi:ATP adenylyltransferase
MTYIAGANAAPATPPPGAEDGTPADPTDPATPTDSAILPLRGAAPPQSAIPTGCVFCDKVAEGEAADRRNLILWRGVYTFALLNLYPYNPGHLMIVPYRHLADVTQLTPDEWAELTAALQRMVRGLDAVYQPQGYNVGMNLGHVAGAGIADHVHLHLVPRWNGDTNFMPVVGQTKVLPESLEATWARLRDGLSSEP